MATVAAWMAVAHQHITEEGSEEMWKLALKGNG